MTEKTLVIAAPLMVDLSDLVADLARIENALYRWKVLDANALKNGRLHAMDEEERRTVSATWPPVRKWLHPTQSGRWLQATNSRLLSA
jgi:hypothetical protein